MKHQNKRRLMSRREMLSLTSTGFGSVALLGLLNGMPSARNLIKQPGNLLGGTQGPHFPPKVKSIIFLYMDGGISQVDSFDYKPRLVKDHGKNPGDLFKVDNTQFNQIGEMMKNLWEFKQHGESGMWMSDLFPHIATCVDDIAFLHSMTADSPIHGSAMLQMNSGKILSGSPALGSWINYGLGSVNENLPGAVAERAIFGRICHKLVDH